MKPKTNPYARRLMYNGLLFVVPTLIFFAVIYWYPLIRAIAMSFYESLPENKVQFAGLKIYGEVFKDSYFWLSLSHTLYFSALAVVIDIILALVLAIGLNNIRSVRLSNALTLFYILPTLVSLAAAGLIWDWILHPQFGLINQLLLNIGLPKMKFLEDPRQVIPSLAVINVWVRIGFSVLILLSGLQSIPETYFDAAKVDGAKGFMLHWYLTLPLLLPQIGAVTLLELILSLKVFDVVYVTTQGGPAGGSEMLMLYLYNNAFRYYRTDKAAVIAVFIFLFLLSFSILQRRLLRARRYEF
jgi:multiple sugar transport system permease protein